MDKTNRSEMMGKTIFGRKHAWAVDVKMTVIQSGIGALSNIPLETFQLLEDFDTQLDDNHQILVGLKGTGKTSALARKAGSFAKSTSVDIIPSSSPYVCTLPKIDWTQYLSNYKHRNDRPELVIRLYKSTTFWSKIWALTLGLICCYFIQKKKNKNLSDILLPSSKDNTKEYLLIHESEIILENRTDMSSQIQGGDFISPIMVKALSLGIAEHEAIQMINEYVTPNIQNKLDKTVGIFIDSVDESFASVRSFVYENEEIGHDIWLAIQGGLIGAIYELAVDTSVKYKVFAAIRYEAFAEYPKTMDDDGSKIEDLCLEMTYDQDLLKKIFLANIAITNPPLILEKSENKSSIERMFPVSPLNHPSIWDLNEDILQWIIRHTFETPRQVVWHGRNIVENIRNPFNRNRGELSKYINGKATEYMESYIKQIDWNPEIESVFCDFKSNVISHAQMISLDKKYPTLKPLSYLYQRGLIGYPDQDYSENSKTGFKQVFTRQDTKIKVGTRILPQRLYYVIHPCLNGLILPLLDIESKEKFVNGLFIVGNELPCPENCNPKVILYTTNDSRELHISYNDGGTLNFNGSVLKENSVDVKDIKEKGVYAFILALFMALKSSENGFASPQNIKDQAKFLKNCHFINEIYGHEPNRGQAEDYFYKTLNIESITDQPYYFSEAHEFITEQFGCTLSTKRYDGHLNYYIEGLSKTDFLVLIRNHLMK